VILTPKALANFSPRLERSDNLGVNNTIFDQTLKGFEPKQTLSGLIRSFTNTQGCRLRSNPGLKLANAFSVIRTYKFSTI
jgi:hypothetical protein